MHTCIAELEASHQVCLAGRGVRHCCCSCNDLTRRKRCCCGGSQYLLWDLASLTCIAELEASPRCVYMCLCSWLAVVIGTAALVEIARTGLAALAAANACLGAGHVFISALQSWRPLTRCACVWLAGSSDKVDFRHCCSSDCFARHNLGWRQPAPL
jgi:hypothetical protein